MTQERGKAQGDARKSVFFLKEMRGGSPCGNREKGKSVVRCGGAEEHHGQAGKEGGNLLRAL